MMHYDFDGNPISFEEWARMFEDKDRVLRQQWAGDYWISTVWLGLDHGFGQTERPLIYETMVFRVAEKPEEREGVEMMRHATKEDALNWHERWVAQAYALAAATEGMEVTDDPGN